MTTSTFDTLDYIKGAEQAGFSREQAQYNAKVFHDLKIEIETPLATLNDLLLAKVDIETNLKLMEYRIITKLGGMLILASGIIITVLGFILHKGV